MRKGKLKKIVSLILAFALILSVPPSLSANAESGEKAEGTAGSESSLVNAAYSRDNAYSKYYEKYKDTVRPNKEINVSGKDFVSATEDADASIMTVDGKENVLRWNGIEGEVSFKVNIAEAGVYNIEASYEALAGNANEIEFSLLIDGESPYSTATRLTLPKVWKNETEIRQDFNDNDIRPGQVELVCWQKSVIKDIDGLYNDPLIFYFEQGEHTITLKSSKAHFAIEYLKLYNPEKPAAYVAPSQAELEANSGADTIKLEGENATYKSARTLYPTNDRTSYLTSPSSPTKTKYNTIGAGSWSQSGQAITWEFHVDKAGYYKLGIRARQNTMRGFYSNRRLYIDGVVPNAESEQIKFQYSTDWEVTVPKDNDDNAMYYYLDEGDHTINLEAVPGEIGEIMDELDEIILNITSYYRQIRQITGPSPDKYNNYKIDKVIDGIVDDFELYSEQLKDIQSKIEKLTGTGGTEAATLNEMAIILDKCVSRPDRIPNLMTQIKDNVTALSSWMRQYREQPLELDFIEISPQNNDFTSTKKSFFESLKFAFFAFIGSFFEDYNSLSENADDADVLTVWVSLGRDQAQVVKQQVENDFNPNYDTKIAIQLVQGGIIEATLANKGPDIALFMGGDFPIQLAARNLVVDISKFDDYEEVTKRFADSAMTLYTYNDGVYGLPVSQSFPMMFYRDDILSSYGIDGSKDIQTWDNLISILPTLQRNYLEVGLVLPVTTTVNGTTTVPTTTEAGSTFAMLMLQNDLNFYNKEMTKTTFDNPIAVEAFDTWTKFYTTYSFEQTYDALTRFRTGDMPVVIQNYSFYNTLAVTAPEIKGCWGFAQVPGTERADGTINHASNSSGSGALIFSDCDDVDGAWDFIKWFTSTETQVQYGNDIEAVMGPLGRFETANVEALSQLSWSQAESKLLLKQLSEQVEIPIIPATYGVTRNITNAFRSVVNDAENARDTLMWYNKDINAEIERKRKDMGLKN